MKGNRQIREKGDKQIRRNMQIKGNRKIGGADAYLTVEAALVLPIMITIILFIVYMLLFQYDRCLLEQDLGAMALWGSSVEEEDGKSLEEMARERMRALYKDKYAAWSFTSLEARLEKNRFAARGSAHLALPIWDMGKWRNESIWRTEAEYGYRRLSPAAFIRLCRGLKKLIR